MTSRYPIRYDLLSSLRGTGLVVTGETGVLETRAYHSAIARYPVRYGRVSSLRGTGVTAVGVPGAAEYEILTGDLVVRGLAGSTVLSRDPYSLIRGLEPLVGAPGSVTYLVQVISTPREIVGIGRRGFAAQIAMVRPDVSGGVNITFEEM